VRGFLQTRKESADCLAPWTLGLLAASHGPGSFFAGRAGVPHGSHGTVSGYPVLTGFSAALDFMLVRGGHA
jgi:hypothetical protein